MSLEEVGLKFSKWVNEALEEIEESAEELKAFFYGFQEEVKNSIHKPTFVVPKTPVAKRLRKIRSRKNENTAQQGVVEARTTRSTRSTRNTCARNTLEIKIEPSSYQTKKLRSTYKNADKTIEEDEKNSTNESVRVSGRKRAHEEEIDVQEAPRKTRRIGKTRATNKGSDGSESKANKNDSMQSADLKCTTINEKNPESEMKSDLEDVTTKGNTKASESEIKLDFEDIAKVNTKNESVADSAIASQVTSDPDVTNSSCTSVKLNNQRADSVQSSDLFQSVENKAECSVSEDSHISNESIPGESSQQHKICNTTVTIVTSTERNTSASNQSLHNEKNAVDIPANSTFVSSVKLELIQHDSPMEAKQQDCIQRAAFSPIVQLKRLSPSEVKTLTDVTAKTNSTSNVKKATTKVSADVHPKTVFSPYASSPVKDRVAAFERLKNERERVAQQAALALKAVEANGEPVRMTRTKARALAAAAATQAKEQQVDGEKKIVTSANRTAEKNAARLAARKSLNRAKKISVVKERRELEITPDSDCGKENSMNSFSTSQLSSKGKSCTSASKKYRTTPLLSNISNLSHSGNRNPGILGSSSKTHYNVINGFITGVESLIIKPAKIVGDDLEKKKEEIKRRMEKEEEAKRKKEELLRLRAEEQKRKREEKMQKAQQAREMLEKEKMEMQIRLKKEKEEKDKLILQEREKLKEQLQLKKQQTQQKAAEMEERRKLEEAARRAKIKEQEEEQQRLQAARKKEQEEHQKHLAEEREAALLREQQAKAQAKLAKEKELKEKEAKQKMAKEKMKAAAVAKPPVLDKTFDVSHTNKVATAHNGLVNPNDYGIDEVAGNSSDEEEEAKRPIPYWARRDVRKPVIEAQSYVQAKLINSLFSCEKTTPNILEMFDHLQSVKRTSSAIWRTPPRLSTLPMP